MGWCHSAEYEFIATLDATGNAGRDDWLDNGVASHGESVADDGTGRQASLSWVRLLARHPVHW